MTRSKRGRRATNNKLNGYTMRRRTVNTESQMQRSTICRNPSFDASTSRRDLEHPFALVKSTEKQHVGNGLTLADSALETSLHDHSVWGKHSKLRNRPVHFVSSGQSKPLEQNLRAESRSRKLSTADSTDAEKKEILGLEGTMTGLPSSALFFIDTVDREKKDINDEVAPKIMPEEISPLESDSNDELILFKGRKARGKDSLSKGPTRRSSTFSVNVTNPQRVDNISFLTTELVNSTLTDTHFTRKMARQPRHNVDHEEDVLLDYINNVRDNDKFVENEAQGSSTRFDLGGSDDGVFFDSEQSNEDAPGGSFVGEIGSFQNINRIDSSSNQSNSDHLEIDNDGVSTVSSNKQDGRAVATTTSDVSVGADNGEGLSSWNVQRKGATDSVGQAEFDFMDWERPSVRCMKRAEKSRLQQISFDNYDTDLELQLQVAWGNNRLKKRERKKQREELRVLGMLGKKTKSENLRTKYPTGMTITEVTHELMLFLQLQTEFVTFPPMNLHARRVIHELANKFNIKSKSIGTADQRRPTLQRTIRTLAYTDAAFNRIVSNVERQFIPRLEIKGRSKRSKTQPASSGSSIAVSYKDGEIVGAAAPELSIRNRGRAMLEKMGWSRGTALGASDNKGILQPVSHAMKRSRAGLG